MGEVKVGDMITVGKYDRYTRIANRYRHECEVVYVESDCGACDGTCDGVVPPNIQPNRLGYEYIHLEYITLAKDSTMMQVIQKTQVIAQIKESYYGKDAYKRGD